MKTWWTTHSTMDCGWRRCSCSPACLLRAAPAFEAQELDLCGCATVPNLQPFDSANSATFPPGTTDDGSSLTIPHPRQTGSSSSAASGCQNRHVSFAANAANYARHDPGGRRRDIVSTVGCCFSFSVSGAAAAAATHRSPESAASADRAASAAATARRRASTAPPSAAPASGRAVALAEPRRRSRTAAAARFSVCRN